MKRTIVALIFAMGSSSAFAHGLPTCRDLVRNTESIVTLRPITSARNPVEAGANVVFSAIVEGVDIGACTARVGVRAGELVIFGLEGAVRAGTCIVEGAAGLVASIIGAILGGR